MRAKHRVTIDRLSIWLSQVSVSESRRLARTIARELGQALGNSIKSQDRLSVAVRQRRGGETSGLLAKRVGRTAALTIGNKGGRGRAG